MDYLKSILTGQSQDDSLEAPGTPPQIMEATRLANLMKQMSSTFRTEMASNRMSLRTVVEQADNLKRSAEDAASAAMETDGDGGASPGHPVFKAARVETASAGSTSHG